MASLTTYSRGFIVQWHTAPAGPKHTLRLPGLRRSFGVAPRGVGGRAGGAGDGQGRGA